MALRWIKANPLPLVFIVTLTLGLLLISAGLFTISCTCGLLGSGGLMVAGGHWVTYLKTTGGRP